MNKCYSLLEQFSTQCRKTKTKVIVVRLLIDSGLCYTICMYILKS